MRGEKNFSIRNYFRTLQTTYMIAFYTYMISIIRFKCQIRFKYQISIIRFKYQISDYHLSECPENIYEPVSVEMKYKFLINLKYLNFIQL